jgi:Tol biopolymer transport system component
VRRCAALLVVATGCGRFGFDSSAIGDRDGAPDDSVASDAEAPICHTGTWGTPAPIPSTVTGSEESQPSITDDELTLYFDSNRTPSAARALWMSTRNSRTEPFGSPTRLATLDDAADDKDPEISTDGHVLYFTSDIGGTDAIYVATRTLLTDPFTLVGPVMFQNDIVAQRSGPALNADGSVMFFGHDLEVAAATRVDVSTYVVDREIDEVNANPTDGNPSITSDGLELFFDSYRNGPAAIFVATRASTSSTFTGLTELSQLRPAGALAAGTPDISSDGRTLYYFVNDGTQIDLYSATRSCD